MFRQKQRSKSNSIDSFGVCLELCLKREILDTLNRNEIPSLQAWLHFLDHLNRIHLRRYKKVHFELYRRRFETWFNLMNLPNKVRVMPPRFVEFQFNLNKFAFPDEISQQVLTLYKRVPKTIIFYNDISAVTAALIYTTLLAKKRSVNLTQKEIINKLNGRPHGVAKVLRQLKNESDIRVLNKYVHYGQEEVERWAELYGNLRSFRKVKKYLEKADGRAPSIVTLRTRLISYCEENGLNYDQWLEGIKRKR
jgi:hypothetical protein